MDQVPALLKQRLEAAGQDHVLARWHTLSAADRLALTRQLETLELDLLLRLYAQREQQAAVPEDHRIAPIPVTQVDDADRQAGEEALSRGEVAVLIVAGGQGSRLGFEHPKGMFEIGPVRNTSLFQILVERTLARQRRYGRPIPLLIMTSPATHDETVAFFEAHQHFGFSPADVFFFRQGTMPALDLATGKLLLEAPGRLFLSPNGHGGTLLALAEAGLLDELGKRGIRHIFYCQVDNALVQIADPLFLGHHLRGRAEVSTKAIAKSGPLDKLGNLALIDGKCSIIEYSDLPEGLARQTDAEGLLRFRVGNPAIHIFDLDFLGRVATGDLRIPFHVARKKVPYLNDLGETVEPFKENALKFETFIFDVLPRAERWRVVETDARTEFLPLKNATGADSPATVRQALSNLAGDWLERAGVRVPRLANGDVAVPLEISPLFALDADELRGKVGPHTLIKGPTYFG
jgi:UDP-N-acetylglucosamine/UDP-N-acetylgalactosamine diphosphorylase